MKNLIVIISLFIIVGCDNMTKDVTSSTPFEGDRIGSLPIAGGIHKIKVDSIEYIIVFNASNGGVAIIKHK